MENPTASIIFFVAGTIIIGGVVFAIVRSRLQRKQRCEQLMKSWEIIADNLSNRLELGLCLSD